MDHCSKSDSKLDASFVDNVSNINDKETDANNVETDNCCVQEMNVVHNKDTEENSLSDMSDTTNKKISTGKINDLEKCAKGNAKQTVVEKLPAVFVPLNRLPEIQVIFFLSFHICNKELLINS